LSVPSREIYGGNSEVPHACQKQTVYTYKSKSISIFFRILDYGVKLTTLDIQK